MLTPLKRLAGETMLIFVEWLISAPSLITQLLIFLGLQFALSMISSLSFETIEREKRLMALTYATTFFAIVSSLRSGSAVLALANGVACFGSIALLFYGRKLILKVQGINTIQSFPKAHSKSKSKSTRQTRKSS